MTMRIAFFNAVRKGSGAEDLVRNVVKKLAEKGLDCRLYVKKPAGYVGPSKTSRVRWISYLPKERRLEECLRNITGFNDFFFPSTALLSRDPWLKSADIWHFHNLHGHFVSIPLLAAQSLKRLVVLSPVDHFLSTGYCPYTLGCMRYLRTCGNCPQLNLAYPGISRDTTRIMLAMKKAAISKSKFHLLVATDYLARHYGSTFVGSRPIEQIYYGVDTQVFRPLERQKCAAKLGVKPSSRFVVGLFHSDVTDPRKGFVPLLAKMKTLSQSERDRFGLLVVGHGSTRAKEYAAGGLDVTSLPFLRSNHELAAALNLCDVLLYPTKAENLSLMCLCSLSCGVPVVSSNEGGQGEAIRDGVNGFLCGADQADEFVGYVARIAEDSKLSETLSYGARQTAVRQFDIGKYAGNLIGYYERLIRGEEQG
jgi:glycosyltransferase involved in cell wall biosynthesis